MLQKLRFVLLVFLSISIVTNAQETCSAIVQDALSAVDEFCTDLGRNQACYGNIDLSAEAQPDASDFAFETTGDIVDVSGLLSLQLSQLNEDAGTWGVAVMSLQADIPGALPGQNVTFILFGDVYIENASSDEQSPMQAFYLQTGIGTIECEEAPGSGLLVQTPDGVDEVSFNVNGVDVQVGSTVLFETQMSENDDSEMEMVISTVEGSAAAIFDDENYPAVEGTQIRLPINNELLPVGRPGLPQAYDSARVAPLPTGPLPRQIGIAPPVMGENLRELQDRVQNGQPPCGIDGLPPCDAILPGLRDGANLPPPDRFGQRFEAGVNCVSPSQNGTSEELTVDNTLPLCPPATRGERMSQIRDVVGTAIEGIDCPEFADANTPCPDDLDGDGIPNDQDNCPARPGAPETDGCPPPRP